jgi:hypothetical protein
VEVYAYAMRQAYAGHQRVIYVHSHGSGYSLVWSAGSHGNTAQYSFVEKQLEKPQILLDFVEAILQREEVDLIVLDGDLSWLIKSVFLKLQRDSSIQLISCTSFDAMPDMSSELSGHAAKRSEYLMASWTIEEFKHAQSTGALVFASSDITFDEIYFYAGGCFRFMKWKINQVISELDRDINKVSDLGKLIGNSALGDSSNSAMNALTSIYGGISTVSSRYVLRKLVKTLSMQMIYSIGYLLNDNASWQGWVTELKVLTLVRNHRSMNFRNIADEIEQWVRCTPMDIDFLQFDDYMDPSLQRSDWDWAIPSKYCQGLFGAIYRVSVHACRWIQVTNATTNCCELKYLIPFIRAMDKHVVELVYVCRQSNFDAFRVPVPDAKDLKAVKTATKKIWLKKSQTLDDTVGGVLPEDSFIIRKVCYEEWTQTWPLVSFESSAQSSLEGRKNV